MTRFAFTLFSIPVLFAQDKLKSDPGSSLHGAKQAMEARKPPVIRVCDADAQGWCWTYTLKNGHYEGVGDNGGSRTMTLETFTPESVVMRVTLPDRPGYSSLNTGKISSSGNMLAGEWSDSNGGKGHIKAYWGAALASAPAVAKAPTPAVNNPGAALFMSILGMRPDGSRLPAADIFERINNLYDQLDKADIRCSADLSRYSDLHPPSCSDKEHVRGQLADANGELLNEMQSLEDAQPKLGAECKAGNKDSCTKLEQVKARLKKDRDFNIDHLFR